MAALNVNQITADLAMKSDEDLQSYAITNKGDPYLFTLAISEANRRKHLRTAQQARGGQQAPKVVDQELAQMAQPMPEEVGIGALPAENMQGMASGGIVAFEEGGDVPGYNGMTDGSFVRLPYGAAGTQANDLYSLPGMVTGQPFGAQAGDAELQARIARIEANPRMRREDKDALIAQARQEFGVPAKTTIPPTTPVGSKPAAAPTTTQTSPRIESDSVVDKAIERKRVEDEAAAAGKKLPPEPGMPSVSSYLKQYEMALPAKEEAQSEETFMNKRAEPMKEYFSKAEATIKKEADRLNTGKEQDFYMSLIQGGLAAAAETGQYALQNIAKGFSVGASSYKDALKDFRKAAQENSKMEMDLMRAKAADKKGDMDAYQKHTEAVAERNAKIDQYKASGVATLLGHSMSASATLGAAKYNREAMGDYRNQAQVEAIRKKVVDEVMGDVRLKNNATLREAEIERRLQRELQRYPNLAQYAGTPTTSGASGASTQGWGKATVIQPQR